MKYTLFYSSQLPKHSFLTKNRLLQFSTFPSFQFDHINSSLYCVNYITNVTLRAHFKKVVVVRSRLPASPPPPRGRHVAGDRPPLRRTQHRAAPARLLQQVHQGHRRGHCKARLLRGAGHAAVRPQHGSHSLMRLGVQIHRAGLQVPARAYQCRQVDRTGHSAALPPEGPHLRLPHHQRYGVPMLLPRGEPQTPAIGQVEVGEHRENSGDGGQRVVLPARCRPREADLVRGVRVRWGRLLHRQWLRKSSNFSRETGTQLCLCLQTKSRKLTLVRLNKITSTDRRGNTYTVQAFPENLERQA